MAGPMRRLSTAKSVTVMPARVAGRLDDRVQALGDEAVVVGLDSQMLMIRIPSLAAPPTWTMSPSIGSPAYP